MTYKSIVKTWIETESDKYIYQLLKEQNIDFKWTDACMVEMKKEENHVLWEVKESITMNNYHHVKIFVGGTCDDFLGVCVSCLWDENHNVIWMSRPDSRKKLGIDEQLKIA